MPRYGSSSHPLFGFTAGDSSDNQRATVFGAMPEHGHAYAMEIRAGHYDPSDTGTAQLAAYDTDGGTPDDLLGRTATFALNTRMADASGGQTYQADLLASFLMPSGQKFGLQALFRGGRMAHGQTASASSMFRRSTSATNNPDPNNYTSSPTETQMTISVLYESNVAPDVPTDLSPADGASFTDTTPTYAGDFVDANETLPNGLTSDYLNAYQIQVRSVAAENATSGTLVWDSGTIGASSTEKANRRFSKDHPSGSPLTPGQRYQWCSRVQDRFGAWSSYTAWQDFLVSGAAVVTLDGNPTGRTTDTTPDLEGKYHHVSGTAADRVQVRLYIGTTLVKTSPEITKAVSSAALPGTSFTITAAESDFGTLASGVAFSYQMRARASSVWSEWSAKRTFFTNGRPSTPTNLRPVSGTAVSDYPTLTVQTTDPDGDALTVTAYLTEDDGTPIDDLAMTYDATLYGGAGGYKVLLTSSELATYDDYRATFDASDGDLTSETSAEIVFTYAEGPSVTVDSPTEDEVLTTDTPTIEWTTTDQQKKQITVYRTSDDALIHDSGLLVNTDSEYELPADLLINETDYYLIVEVTDSAPLVGTSAIRNFRLEYTPPDPVENFIASTETAAMDLTPSVVRLTWEPVMTDAADFLYYRVTRRLSTQAADDASAMVAIPSVDQGDWIDTDAPPGADLIYGIQQVVRESSFDVLRSDIVESTVRLDLDGPVISDVRDGLTLRVAIESLQEYEEELVSDQTLIHTWDGGPGYLFEGPTEYSDLPMVANLRANDAATTQQQIAQLKALARFRTDGSPVMACLRDHLGNRFFGRVRDVKIVYQRLDRAQVSFLWTELTYSDVPEAFG